MLVRDRKVDVLCISESWLVPNLRDIFVMIQSYKIFRYDGGRGGGVCAYEKDVLTANVIDPNVPKQEGVKDVWLTIVSQLTSNHGRMCL